MSAVRPFGVGSEAVSEVSRFLACEVRLLPFKSSWETQVETSRSAWHGFIARSIVSCVVVLQLLLPTLEAVEMRTEGGHEGSTVEPELIWFYLIARAILGFGIYSTQYTLCLMVQQCPQWCACTVHFFKL